jgi:hypothetical protein
MPRTQEEHIPYAEVTWALRETVQVTMIWHDFDELKTTYLVTRLLFGPVIDKRSVKPWDHALLLEFGDSGEVVINSDLHNSNDLEKWSELVDALSLSPYFPELGDYVTTEVEP